MDAHEKPENVGESEILQLSYKKFFYLRTIL